MRSPAWSCIAGSGFKNRRSFRSRPTMSPLTDSRMVFPARWCPVPIWTANIPNCSAPTHLKCSKSHGFRHGGRESRHKIPILTKFHNGENIRLQNPKNPVDYERNEIFPVVFSISFFTIILIIRKFFLFLLPGICHGGFSNSRKPPGLPCFRVWTADDTEGEVSNLRPIFYDADDSVEIMNFLT